MGKLTHFIENLDYRKSLFVTCAILIFLLAFIGGVGLHSMNQLNRKFTLLRSQSLRAVELLGQAREIQWKLRAGVGDRMDLLPHTGRQLPHKERELAHQLEARMQAYQSFADTQYEKEYLQQWMKAYADYMRFRSQYFALLDAGKTAEAKTHRTRMIVPVSDATARYLDGLLAYQSKEATEKERTISASIRKYEWILFLFVAAGVILSSSVAWFAVKRTSDAVGLRFEALDKMVTLGEITGGIAHEINNPLAVIQIVSEQLQDVVNMESLDRTYIQKMGKQINDGTSRISKIVSGLKVFSRESSEDDFISVKVKNLIDETLAFCTHKMKRNSIKLSLVGHWDEGLIIQGKQTELSQVLVNLLVNAADAIEHLRDKWIQIGLVEHLDSIEVSITDSGAGIPENIRDKMFRQSFTTKPVSKGTGLGLGICRRIVEHHQGKIFVDAKCKNTRFVIVLPKAQPDEVSQIKAA